MSDEKGKIMDSPVFEFGRISDDGFEIKKYGRLIKQYCAYSEDTICSGWCPQFVGPYYGPFTWMGRTSHRIQISICDDIVLVFEKFDVE